MLVSMATTSEESAEQDGAQEDVVGGAMLALLDQGDDALDGVTPGEDEEDEETDEDEGIPFGIQEDVECFLLHARGKKTLKSYERAIKLLLAWCERHKNEDLIKEVTKMDDEVFQFDYKKLAKSLESPNNVFFRYTRTELRLPHLTLTFQPAFQIPTRLPHWIHAQ